MNEKLLDVSIHLIPKPAESESWLEEWEKLATLQGQSKALLHDKDLHKKHDLQGPGTLVIQDSPITRTLTTTVHQAILTKILRQHIMTREDWSDEDWEAIDWEGLKRARKTIPSNQQRTLTKWSFGWLPTGRQLQRHDANKSGRCPSCTAHQETGEHILRCRHPERIKVWLSW